MKLSDVPHIARHLLEKYRLLQKGWRFKWDHAKRRAGQCRYSTKTISLSVGYAKLNVDDRPYDVLDTILHEVAHALAGPGTNHGPQWVAQCKLIGAKPERCCDAQVEMPKGRYRANCPTCGKPYYRHRRAKKGRWFYCRKCGREVGVLHFVDTAALAQQPKPLGKLPPTIAQQPYSPPPPEVLP